MLFAEVHEFKQKCSEISEVISMEAETYSAHV